MNPFIFGTSKPLHFTVGSLAKIGEPVQAHIGGRVLLATDRGLMRTGIVNRALAALAAAGIAAELFANVEADPSEAVTLKAVERAWMAEVNDVVGLGGGSSLDVAKLVVLLTVGQEKLEEIYGMAMPEACISRSSSRQLPLALGLT